jgi:hypothetical protein
MCAHVSPQKSDLLAFKFKGEKMYKRPMAFVCSPQSGKVQANTKKAQEYSRIVFDKGYMPIAPHLIFTQFLDDSIPEERSEAMKMNNVLIRKSHIMFVCGDIISEGMKTEMIYARSIGLTVVPLEGIIRIEEYLKGVN